MTQIKKLHTNARIGAVFHKAWSFIGDLSDKIGMIISVLIKGNALVNAYSAQYGKLGFVISADEFKLNSEEPGRTELKREAKDFRRIDVKKEDG